MTLLPKVKLKTAVNFPGNVIGGAGIDVTKAHGNYTIDLDYGDFAPPVASLPDPPSLTTLLWNKNLDRYVLSGIDLIVGGASGNFIQAGTGAVTRTMQDKVREKVSVKDYGAVGDGTADDTSAIWTAWSAVTSMNPQPELVFPAGIYKASSFPNFAHDYAWITSRGQVTLHCTGSGGIVFDNGETSTSGSGNHFIKFGPFTILAPAAGNAVLINGIHHSFFDVSVKSTAAGGNGVAIGFCVNSEFRINCSFAAGPPAIGLLIGFGTPDTPTCWCTFYNTTIEGLATGIQFEYAEGNLLLGGTGEAGGKGLYMDSTSFNNRVVGMDFEVNTSNDVEMSGVCNSIIDCDTGIEPTIPTSPKAIVIGPTAHYCDIIGGTHHNVTNNGVLCRLMDLTYNNASGGGGALLDFGTNTITSNVIDKGAGLAWGAFVAWTAFTPIVESAGGGMPTFSPAPTGRYLIVGKTVFVSIKISVTANNGATGYLQVDNLPKKAFSDQVLAGRNHTGGSMLQCFLANNTTAGAIVKYDGTYPLLDNQTLIVTGSYESQ